MSGRTVSAINIGIVGGGSFCRKFLQLPKHTMKEALYALTAGVAQPTQLPDGSMKEVPEAQIIAVVDPDWQAEGLAYARNLGLKTFTDYHELYDPQLEIALIFILTSQRQVLEGILKSKPAHVAILSYQAFELFQRASGLENQLWHRTKEMETILDGISDFVLVITPEQEIFEVNGAFLKQMGFSRGEVIGHKCYEIFRRANYPCNRNDRECPLNEVIRNKSPRQRVRKRVDHEGNSHYIETTVYPVWENNGRISKFVEISRDITARIKNEEEMRRRLELMVEERTRKLKETQGRLIHEDKMASLGKLSASVVHEINNPIAGTLNLILLMKRIIEEGDISRKEVEQFDQYLELMETETRRIGGIVSNLLAFSRQSRMKMKKVALNRIIEKTLFLTSNLLKIHGIRIETHLDSNLPEIFASEDQLQQVFMNFVTNAAEAMEEAKGGILRIETNHCHEDGEIVVSFKDTGVGIPRENLSQLFEPFFTTKKRGKGIGLGLSVAYGIIEEHGGSINVISDRGEGTTFEVRLPLQQAFMREAQQGGSLEPY